MLIIKEGCVSGVGCFDVYCADLAICKVRVNVLKLSRIRYDARTLNADGTLRKLFLVYGLSGIADYCDDILEGG